jgi:hypothetical protein
MPHRFEASVNLPLNDQRSVYDNYNFHPSTTYSSSQRGGFTFRVCNWYSDGKNCIYINVESDKTLLQLKGRIAECLNIFLSTDKFYLTTFDENQKQWIRIDDSNTSVTINQLKIDPGSLLRIRYHNQQVSDDSHPPYSTSVATNNSCDLMLKLCKKPFDISDYTYLKTNSSSTLAELRRQAYDRFNKQSKDQPIYLWNNDAWTKIEPDFNTCLVADLPSVSYAYISIDADEESGHSKQPSGLCGLANLGNTCYMNSVFQCLSNIPEFTKRILALNDNEVNAPIIGEYLKLIKKIWSGQYTNIRPESVLDSINDNLPRYAVIDSKMHKNL